uniref:Uncharacterized protein n=1 Tax=Romanomermis culicivorax TaxID=13658 RepID=A0A915IBS7_ROMCU
MGGVNGIINAELLSPQAGDPSQYQCGHVVRDGRLLFSVRWTIKFAKILVQSERGIRCANVNGHGDADAKKLIKTISCNVRSMKNSTDGSIRGGW